MDHPGHPWPDSGRQSHGAKHREDFYRYSQQDCDQSYPSLDQRVRDRHWASPSARYGAHFTGPPIRTEQYPYSSHQYPYCYGQPEYQRPQSRHGLDYPPHTQWDYRDNYAYYDNDYYRGQHGRQDAGQWLHQETWSSDNFHERTFKQELSGSSHTKDYRYDHGRDSSLHHLNDYEDYPPREDEDLSSCYLGTLESSKQSGLSSSSYELSQYINGAEHSDCVTQPAYTCDAEQQHETSAPLKYSIPHAVVSFGPAGQLIRVSPSFSTLENTSKLEIHSLEVILSETQDQQAMRNFPGPLTREDLHKVDAIEFAHQQTGLCMRDEGLHDKSSAALVWNLLILLCRQNAQIVGSDIAELLMQGSHLDGSCDTEGQTLIDFSESVPPDAPPCRGDDLLTGNWSSFNSETSEKALQSYTKLLLAGRKKEALDSAMSNGLWGHALFLASKMDNRAYTTVLNRFTGQLTASDPLQTLFQLLSGRIPAVATCCGNEKWGDWRPHLAVMLSNETGDAAVQQKAIITMGDTLDSRGLTHAAHVCYLTASVPFGVFTHKAERLVLLGSSHRQSFPYFAKNSAIQCTEMYEYCQTLGGKCFSIPSFQVYKLLYATRLLDCGLASQAFHYCEVVGKAILTQMEPHFVLTGEVIKLADRLRHSEGQFTEAGVGGAGREPDWLKQLRTRHHSLQMGNFDCFETCLSAPDECALARDHNNIYTGSDLDDLSRNIQSPEPEFLYYRGTEDQESFVGEAAESTEEMTVLSQNISGTPNWHHSNPLMPVTGDYSPSALMVAASQGSYHNTDSAEVRTAAPHCPRSNLSSTAEVAGSISADARIGAKILDVDISGQGQNQQSHLAVMEAPEQTTEPAKPSTKTGWFSGWFKSKPKDVQKEGPDMTVQAETELPPTIGVCPPAIVSPPGMYSSPSSPAGINPFSRKAGQQLG